MPQAFEADLGTENSSIVNMQSVLRHSDDICDMGHRYGKPSSNEIQIYKCIAFW